MKQFSHFQKLTFALLGIMALPVAWSSRGLVARDIPSTVQVVFKNATGPYAETVRRSGILDTIDLDKTYYTYLLPEDVGMSAEAFLARKDLLKVIKYHILVETVDDEPLSGGASPDDRVARGEQIKMRTLLGPAVTVTQVGPPNLRRSFVNGIELDGDPFGISSGNGNIVNAETLIPFPKI